MRHRTGMTLMELTFALFSLSILGLAIASLMAATGDAWETRDEHREQSQSVRAVSTQLTNWVRQSQRVVALHSGSDFADLLLWVDNDQFPNEVNLSELKLLTFERATGKLTLHTADLTAAQKLQPGANPSFAPATASSTAFPATFRGRSDTDGYDMAVDVRRFKATAANGPDTNAPYKYVNLELWLAGPDRVGDQVVMIGGWTRAPDTAVDFVNDPDADATVNVDVTYTGP